MLEIIGPHTKRPIRMAVALRILDSFDPMGARFIDFKQGRMTMHAANAAVAIDKAHGSYRCKDARKELKAMRQDADHALQNKFDQSLTIIGPGNEVGELFQHLQRIQIEGR